MLAISLLQSKTFKCVYHYKMMKFSKGKLGERYAKKFSEVILGRGVGRWRTGKEQLNVSNLSVSI